MSTFRTQNMTLLAKVETTAGTDAVPVVGTDAIAAEEVTVSDDWELEDTNEKTGGLDRSTRVTGGGSASLSATVLLKGSGTGGQAPEVGPLLRGSGLAQTLLAADETDVTLAGSTATSVNLAAGQVAANNDYVGHLITVDGEDRVITASNAAGDSVEVYPALSGAAGTGVAYTIHAAATYVPASSGLETLTAYAYAHNSASGANHRLRKVLGGASTLQLALPVRRPGRFTFGLRGQMVAPTDVADPGAATYDGISPPVLVLTDAYLDGNQIEFSELSLDFGNELELADAPSTAYGYDVASIIRRRISGRINPRMALVATRNAFADVSAGTTKELWVRFGTGDGGVISLYVPAARFVGSSEVDNRGFLHEGLDFDAAGQDTGAYISYS